MRLAKGNNSVLTTGFIQDYLQLYQYVMSGVLIKVDTPPSTNPVTFNFKINGSIVIPDTTLIIPATQNSINITYSQVLYQGDICTFECTSCLDAGVGNPFYLGIY